jgi:hypothetical protein
MQMPMRRGLFILCLLLADCSKELSRSEAERQIKEHETINEWAWYLPLQKEALAKGESQAYWNYHAASNVIQIVRSVDDSVASITNEWIQLLAPVPVTVAVTGISDVPGTANLKETRFSWTYPQLPSKLRRFAAIGGSGTAIFRLFDDGWRVERVDVTPSNQGFTLTEAEKKGEEEDLAAERERRRVALEEEGRLRVLAAEAQAKIAAAKKLEQERVARLVTEATTPTKTLMTIQFPRFFYPLNNSASFTPPKAQAITLTDVNIRFIDKHGRTFLFNFGRGIQFRTKSCSEIQNVVHESLPDAGRVFVMVNNDCNDEIQFPTENQGQRDELINKTTEAIRHWRTRFGSLPVHWFQ